MREQRREKQAERRGIFEWCLLARNYTPEIDLELTHRSARRLALPHRPDASAKAT